MKFNSLSRLFAPRQENRLLERDSWRDWSNLQKQVICHFKDAVKNGTITVEEVDVCLCGSEQFLPISKIDRFSIKSPTKLCLNCGLILTSPRISASSANEYYEKYYPNLLSSKTNAENLQYIYSETQGEKVYSYICEAMTGRKSLKILDYAAGLGDVSSYLRKRFRNDGVQVEIVAIETNSMMKQELLNKDICVIDERHLDKHISSFDLIILSHIIEHIHDFQNLLSRLKKTLNNAGRMYIEVSGVLSIHKRENYMFSYTGYSIHAHLYNFSLASLSYYVVQQGFDILDANEEVQLLVAPDSYSWLDFNRRRKQLKIVQFFAEDSVTVITNYLRNLEDLWPQLNSVEDYKRKLTVAENKLENSNACLRDAEISINSKLNTLESPIEDPKGYLDELDIFERYPLKEWLLDLSLQFESNPDDIELTSAVFIKGMQVQANGFIQLKALESDFYIYTTQNQDFELILKPGQDVESISIQTFEREENIRSESPVLLKLHAGLNRIHLTAQATDDSTQSYALLLKPRT
jgi:SAM-dependent methyltransferase